MWISLLPVLQSPHLHYYRTYRERRTKNLLALSQRKNMIPFEDDAVRAIFDSYPDEVRDRLMEVRALIFNAAANTSGVGPNEETLKWREPAYLTSTTKSGSTIRFGWKAGQSVGILGVFQLPN